MICLHCGKTLDPSEYETGWHKRCIEKFFGTSTLPELTVTKKEVERLVTTSVDRGYTVPGVQKKISLHLSSGRPARLTLVDYPSGYIMKPQTEYYDHLPEFEFLAMLMAKVAGVKTVPFALYRAGAEYVYLTKRIDRQGPERLAMEDFCQLQGRLSDEKYRSSYEKCIKTLLAHSHAPGVDVEEIFSRVVLSYLIGNSDMHLKNFSLIESTPGARDFCLSPAYDVLPVNVVEPSDKDELALALNGKTRKLRRKDFLEFASYCGLSEKTASRLIAHLCDCLPTFAQLIDNSFLYAKQKAKVTKLIIARARKITLERV